MVSALILNKLYQLKNKYQLLKSDFQYNESNKLYLDKLYNKIKDLEFLIDNKSKYVNIKLILDDIKNEEVINDLINNKISFETYNFLELYEIYKSIEINFNKYIKVDNQNIWNILWRVIILEGLSNNNIIEFVYYKQNFNYNFLFFASYHLYKQFKRNKPINTFIIDFLLQQENQNLIEQVYNPLFLPSYVAFEHSTLYYLNFINYKNKLNFLKIKKIKKILKIKQSF